MKKKRQRQTLFNTKVLRKVKHDHQIDFSSKIATYNYKLALTLNLRSRKI